MPERTVKPYVYSRPGPVERKHGIKKDHEGCMAVYEGRLAEIASLVADLDVARQAAGTALAHSRCDCPFCEEARTKYHEHDIGEY